MKKAKNDGDLRSIKLVIDNYPEGEAEYLDVANNLENEELGGEEKYRSAGNFIDRDDLWKNLQRNISVCFREMKCV